MIRNWTWKIRIHSNARIMFDSISTKAAIIIMLKIREKT